MKITERQKALYEYLEGRGDDWTLQGEVACDLNDYYNINYYFLAHDYSEFHDTPIRSLMTRDIRAINDSDEFEKIIISSSKGIKLANEEEFSKFISKQYASVFRRLQRVRTKEKKGKAHYNILFNENAEFDTVESLLRKFEGDLK